MPYIYRRCITDRQVGHKFQIVKFGVIGCYTWWKKKKVDKLRGEIEKEKCIGN